MRRAPLALAAAGCLVLVAAPVGAGAAVPIGHSTAGLSTSVHSASVVSAAGQSTVDPAARSATADMTTPLAQPSRKVKFNTFPDWDGSTNLYPFGNPDTATYGQTFTSASRPSEMKKFVFSIAGGSGSGRIVFQGWVYQWDGDRAVGPALWQSDVKSKRFVDGEYRDIQFITSGTEPKLTPNTEYVVFLSVSTTYEESAPNSFAQWALVPPPGGFDGGAAVWLNNGGDEAQWTSTAWDSLADGSDFVTKINTEVYD